MLWGGVATAGGGEEEQQRTERAVKTLGERSNANGGACEHRAILSGDVDINVVVLSLFLIRALRSPPGSAGACWRTAASRARGITTRARCVARTAAATPSSRRRNGGTTAGAAAK